MNIIVINPADDTLAQLADETWLDAAPPKTTRTISAQYQQKIDAAKAATKENGWPALAGTPAQKKWACTIREELSRNTAIPASLFGALARHYIKSKQWIELRADLQLNTRATVLRLQQLPWLK